MHIFFSVGEPSGDRHAVHLMESLRKQNPDAVFSGFGGPLMEKSGCRLLYQLTDLAVMGIVAVLPLVWQFYKLMKKAERSFRENRPDAVVLVDFPGFNWWIAWKAKAAGIPVFYYMPPQLWAWAPWRIGRVRKNIDCVLCALPFEKTWYEQRGASVEYVGHPFFDEVAEQNLDENFVEGQQRNGRKLVAILPGSRNQEVRKNWPVLLEVMKSTSAKHPDCEFLVANYKEAHQEQCVQSLREEAPSLQVTCHVGKTSEIIEAASCAVMVSGSVSLELLARTTPAIVVYRAGWVFALIARLFITCKYMSLPNLLAGRPLFPEFPTFGPVSRAVPGISAILDEWLSNPESFEAVQHDVAELRDESFQTGAGVMAADAILRRLSTMGQTRQAA